MSHNKFYPLLVDEIKPETEESVSITFRIPDDLIELFHFQPGQYLTLKTNLDGEEIRRSYSISSAPHQHKWRVGVKKVKGGMMSTFLNNELKAGDTIEVLPPQGNFTLNEGKESSTYVFFAAGSGITPIMSMITYLLEKKEDRVFLFYGNKAVDRIMYREEIEALKNKYLKRLVVHHVLSQEKVGSPLFHGRIDAQKCGSYLDKIIGPQDVKQFLICGPGPMIFEIEAFLKDRGVDPKNIRYELFTTADLPPSQTSEIKSDKTEKTTIQSSSTIKLKLDGLFSEFAMPAEGISILDAAMKAGADVPFSCKGGVCSTCKAMLVEGEVKMDLNYALEDEEVEAGYILTCQSHPLTSEVIVDYDQA